MFAAQTDQTRAIHLDLPPAYWYPNCLLIEIEELEDLRDDGIALGPHFGVKPCDRFGWKPSSDSKCGPSSAMLSSPRSSSASKYHEVN